jgi:hypothetical protein
MANIDVFICLKNYVEMTDPKTSKSTVGPERKAGGDMYVMPDSDNWDNLKQTARQNKTVLNVYTEDNGTSTIDKLLASLTTVGKTVVFAGHSWTDGRLLPNGRIQSGFGIRVGYGSAIGTFGVTRPAYDSNGNIYGQYKSIPIIKAFRFFVFSCNPGSDFRSIMQNHLSKGSMAYFTRGGSDGQVWIPAIEMAAYVATAQMIFNKERDAVKEANMVLKNQKLPFSNGDVMEGVMGIK